MGRRCICFQEVCQDGPGNVSGLLLRLAPRLNKNDTWNRKALDPSLKLAITLHYLATGDS